MKAFPKPVALALLLAATAGPSLAQEAPRGFFFEKGDRIVFLGDSITEQYEYSTDIELYLTTRFPSPGIWSSSTPASVATPPNGGAGRFASHVLAEKPTAVTDRLRHERRRLWRLQPGRLPSRFAKNTEAMLDAADKAKVRIAASFAQRR